MTKEEAMRIISLIGENNGRPVPELQQGAFFSNAGSMDYQETRRLLSELAKTTKWIAVSDIFNSGAGSFIAKTETLLSRVGAAGVLKEAREGETFTPRETAALEKLGVNRLANLRLDRATRTLQAALADEPHKPDVRGLPGGAARVVEASTK